MLWSVLMAVAIAGESIPVTCEAVFIGPAGDCGLEGEWVASGTAANENAAKKRAMARLLEAAELATAASAVQSAGSLAVVVAEQQRETCPTAVAELARVSCFPSLELATPQTCFADFSADECPTTQVIILEGIGFKTMEKVRQQICREVEQTVQTAGLSEAEQLICRSRCLVESRVRCR